MIPKLKSYIKKNDALLTLAKAVMHPWVTVIGWLYGAYLTLRYVDEWSSFPVIRFDGDIIRLKIKKGHGSRLILRGNLIVTPFSGGESTSAIYLGLGARCCIEGDFVVGDDVRLVVSENAVLHIEGKRKSSGSGITCQSKVMVKNSVKIGADTIISWNVFITDSDHHPMNGEHLSDETIIGHHVWIASGVQVLKGARIGDDSIIGGQSVVLKGEYPEKSLLAGVPARVKGKAADWSRD